MNEIEKFMMASIAGFALGAIFFGGLWWTVRKGVLSKRPVAVFFASLLLRTGLVVAGFYYVSGGDWKRLLLCLLGFVAARGIVTWLTRSPSANPIHPAREVYHAPESR